MVERPHRALYRRRRRQGVLVQLFDHHTQPVQPFVA